MMATGESHTPAPQLDLPELASLLRRRVAGEPFPHSFIHEADAYSAPPEDLVREREHAPGTGQAGDGKGMAWYFCSTANCHESTGGAPRRNRQVGGGGERRFWHPEGGKEPILGPDRKPVGAYRRTLSYVLKSKNPPGAKKSFRNKRLGWCMVEIGLQQQDGGAGHQHQLVLCKVYRSPRSTADPAETSTAAAGAEDAGTGISGVEDGQRDSAQEPLDVYRSPRADAEAMPCPTPSECDNQSMELAMEDGRPVIVQNSYIPQTPGTVITKTRDMSKSILTSIELKRNVTILDIERTSTLDQDAFVLVVKASSIFQNFEDLGISVDWEATSEGKMSFTLVPSQLLSQEVIQPALDKAVQKLQKIATVDRLQDRSVISLIGSPQMSIVILGKALDVLGSNNFTVDKVPRWSPKVANVSLVVHDSAAERCEQLLHSAFFELNGCPVPVNSSGAASSSDKRKADDGHPEAPPGVRQERLEELERALLSDNELELEFFDSGGSCLMPVGMDDIGGMDDIFSMVEYQSGPGPRRIRLLNSLLPSSDPAQELVPLRRRVQSEEEQELTEAEESGSELGSVTGEMERSHQESTTNHDGRGLGGSWVRRLAIVKRSMPSAGHSYSLRSRLAACLFDIGLRLLTTLAVLWLAACLARIFAKQTAME